MHVRVDNHPDDDLLLSANGLTTITCMYLDRYIGEELSEYFKIPSGVLTTSASTSPSP